MRFHCVVLLMVLVCCNQPPGAGTEGHACASWPAGSPCDDELRCVDDTCVPCGGVDMMCCSNVGGEFCNTGLACDDAVDSLGTCTGSCGLIGLPCCGDETCDAGTCNNDGICEGETSDPCFSGGTPHVVNVIDNLCAAWTVTFMTNTAEEAEDCRQQLVAAAKPEEEVCALDTTPDLTNVCKDGWGPMQLWNCSAAQLATCEANWCDTCAWTTTTTDCPFGP